MRTFKRHLERSRSIAGFSLLVALLLAPLSDRAAASNEKPVVSDEQRESDGTKRVDFIHEGKRYRLELTVAQTERANDDSWILEGRATGRLLRYNRKTGRFDIRIDSDRGDSKTSLRVSKSGKKLQTHLGNSTGAASFSGLEGYNFSVEVNVPTAEAPGAEIAPELVVEFQLISNKVEKDGTSRILKSVRLPLSWKASADAKSPNGIGCVRARSETELES